MADNLFVTYLKQQLPLVEKTLGEVAPKACNSTEATPEADLGRFLYEPLASFTAGGGKRVRPVLCLLGAQAVGAEAELALAPAVAIELFQSAALIHDDIADESELRRGKPCLYRTEGVGIATNVGDLALTEVFEVVLADDALPEGRKLAVLSRLVDMERRTLEGQALDLGWARDGRWDISVDDYLYMVISKTAYYTAASPLAIGAVCGGARTELAERLASVGLHAGAAFQLQDDLLNLVGDADAQGKDFRSDITEGKRTLAVIHALATLGEAEKGELVALLSGGVTGQSELARAVELIELGGGIEACRELAAKETKAAQDLIAELTANGEITAEAGATLAAMADFFVERAS